METEKYNISSPKNYQSFLDSGDTLLLNDINIQDLKNGDRIVIAREGDSIEIEVKL